MNIRVILFSSLAFNVILAGLIVASLARPESPPDTRLSHDPRAGSITDSQTSDRSSPAPGFCRLDGTLWTQFDSDDLLTLARRLREAGFPPGAIRRVIWDLNSARGEIARAAIQGRSADTPYWKNLPYFPDDPAKRDKIREINQRGNQVYTKLMTDPEFIGDDEEFGSHMRDRFGNLPTPKLQQVVKVVADYSEMRQALWIAARKANADDDDTTADHEKLALLDAEEQRDLQRIMSPEEYAEFRYRSSPTAGRLREQLEVFRPTEQEYKTIFSLQQTIDAKFNISSSNPEPKDKQAYKDAMSTLGPQLQSALGEERYAEYLVAIDQTNNKLKRIVTRLDLPLTTVNTLTAVQSEISLRADAVREDASLSDTDRAAQLSLLAQEAQARLNATLGSRGYEAYEQVKGSWLRALTDRPPAPAK